MPTNVDPWKASKNFIQKDYWTWRRPTPRKNWKLNHCKENKQSQVNKSPDAPKWTKYHVKTTYNHLSLRKCIGRPKQQYKGVQLISKSCVLTKKPLNFSMSSVIWPFFTRIWRLCPTALAPLCKLLQLRLCHPTKQLPHKGPWLRRKRCGMTVSTLGRKVTPCRPPPRSSKPQGCQHWIGPRYWGLHLLPNWACHYSPPLPLCPWTTRYHQYWVNAIAGFLGRKLPPGDWAQPSRARVDGRHRLQDTSVHHGSLEHRNACLTSVIAWGGITIMDLSMLILTRLPIIALLNPLDNCGLQRTTPQLLILCLIYAT